MYNKRMINLSVKIYFYRSTVKSVLSLFSGVPLFIFSQLYLLLFCIGLALSHFLLCVFFLYCSFFLSLYILGTLRKHTTEEEHNKMKSRIEVDIKVSWWIVDLRADHLHAVESTRRRNRVNSKRDTLG